MVVTIPIISGLVTDGAGGFKFVNKTSTTAVTIAAADSSDPRTDIITIDSSGNVTKTDGTPTTETGDVEEAPMPALATDEILLCKVRVEAGVSVIATDKVVGRAINIAKQGIIIRKSADQTHTQSNTTLEDDADLLFPVIASTTYLVEMIVLEDSGTTPDYKFGWSVPANCTIKFQYAPTDTSTALGPTGTEASTPVVFGNGAGNVVILVIHAIVIVGATLGTVTFRHAQNTSDASDTKTLANSLMRVQQIS